jgi:hypothetical protein
MPGVLRGEWGAVTADELEFCLLGPLVVRSGGAVVPVRQAKQRVLPATLLLDGNRVVRVDALAEALWGAATPPSARDTVRNYVKRDALGEAVQDLFLHGRRDEAIAAVPRQLAADISLVGTKVRIRDDLPMWEEVGVTTLVIGGGSPQDMRAAAEAILGA